MHDLQLPRKGFWQKNELKFKDDPVWLDKYGLVAFAFQSPHNLCSHIWHYVLSRIWRNLHRDIEIDRNRKSEELLKLGGG